ncbi:MAG: PhzF family phenazine biosynthesis protein [Chloroflexota bacterium]
MTRVRLFQIDAFADAVFLGNPAAVCPLDAWLPEHTMQAIAEENNLAETAFFVETHDGYDLRWFTPRFEVDLCGHATLASAFVVYEALGYTRDAVRFQTRSGALEVRRDGDLFVMKFPSYPPTVCDDPPSPLLDGLGATPEAVVQGGGDYFAVYADEEAVVALRPDLRTFESLPSRGVCVTSPGREVDCVSRYFAPRFGIPEDPVTGSTHCTLVPYWSLRLGKTRLHARQESRRGGSLFCEALGDRVTIAGRAVMYSEGSVLL